MERDESRRYQHSILYLGFMIFGGIAAWAGSLVVNYGAARTLCNEGAMWGLYLINAFFFVVALASVLLAAQERAKSRKEGPDGNIAAGSNGFLAVLGIILGVLAIFGIIASIIGIALFVCM